MINIPYKSISDVANELGVKTHTLRFWETKFPYLTPKKNGGSVRYYDNNDVLYLQQIKIYLKEKCYTIKGVCNVIKIIGIEEFRNDCNLTEFNSNFSRNLPVDQIKGLMASNNEQMNVLPLFGIDVTDDQPPLPMFSDTLEKNGKKSRQSINIDGLKLILNRLKKLQNKIS